MQTKLLLLASLVAVGCGGGGSDKDKTPLIDAPVAPVVDGPAACSAAASITALTNPFMAYAADTDPDTTGNQEAYRYIGDLNADTRPDWLYVELFEGPPPGYTTANFPATPFTIQLTGAELDYGTCSTCVTLITDVNLENTEDLEYVDDYMATAGSVTINTLTATTISGTLNNVTFGHVDFTMDGQMPNASGCTAVTGASIAFDGAVMASARGQGRSRYAVRARVNKH